MKKYSSVRQTLSFQRTTAAFVVFALLLTFFFFYGDRLQTVVRADTSVPISLKTFGTAATENFDTLAASGTSSATPTGWGFSETGTNANSTYTAGTGSSNAGDTYSFGTGADRAFGGLRSSPLVPVIGAAYTNNAGGTINSLAVSYVGEQWRLGATGRPDRLDFQYSTDATSLTTGTWTNVDALDFTAPVTAGTVGALDGNAAANRTTISSTISGLAIPAGANFYLRWTDFDATGADDGLAVDDFSLTPGGTVGGATNPSGTGAALPNTVAAGGGVLLTVNVTSGSNPTSTNLVVTANLSAIGGSASQSFYDDGTNGDSIIGDNKFSFQTTVAGTTTVGAKSLPVTITDAQSRTGSTSIAVTVTSNAPSASGAANPSSLAVDETTLLTVNVTPGVNPTSTGINVIGNLSAIGGSATQTFLDDGLNGDQTAGDNIYSYQATVATATTSGTKNLSITVTDSQSRTATTTISLTVTGSGSTSGHNPQEHLVMGNPTNATTDVNNPTNYLLLKDQYVMSYHRDRAIPNWVSWHLDSSWIGSTGRQDTFRPDPSLPSGWYQVSSTSYSGSGFDRGHHTPSGDRTSSVADNSATFFMTNMMPQAPDNNQGPWERLEIDSRTLVSQGNELYILAGGTGSGGTGSNGSATTIDGGRIAVPQYTWKVILVLPVGDNDVSRVTANTRVIAVIMPNNNGIRSDEWQKYLATVDQVEALTGYDFFSNVPVDIQAAIESRLDSASNTSPQTVAGGTYANLALTSPNVTISGNVTVTGTLDLGPDTLTTGNFKITLGPNAVVARQNGYINGNIEKQFATAPTSFEYPVGTAGGYSPLTINITNLGSSPSSLTVSATEATAPNAPNPARTLKRYWTLTENGDLTANLVFHYLDGDLPAGISESSFKLYRSEGAFVEIPASVDTAANTVTANNISQFSNWTLYAPLAPTAAEVTVGGRVTTDDGRAISNVLITLTDSNGRVQTTRTNAFGDYNFPEVEAGLTCIITATGKRFTFEQATYILSVTEVNDAVNFIAVPKSGLRVVF